LTIRQEWFCDFCGKKLTDCSINPDHMGYCHTYVGASDGWTNCFRQCSKPDGPHICETCIQQIQAGEYRSSFGSKKRKD